MVIGAWLRSECSALLDLLLPPYCAHCRRNRVESPDHFCPECQVGVLRLSSPACPCCALPYPTIDGTDHSCADCLRDPPPFLWTVAAGLYEETLRDAIWRYKYRRVLTLERPLVRLLADALAPRLDGPTPDLLVPVPLHPFRLRERGYNQALLLARALGRHFELDVAPRLLSRRRPTAQQQGLSAVDRHDNLRDAFALTRSLDGERVLLVDDVMTTGATARSCAQTLLDGGAKSVSVAVLGRARRHHL
jgi:ComF family protein